MPLSELIDKKRKEGYKPEDFTEAYWLDPHASHDFARINRDPSHLIKYFTDLFTLLPEGPILDVGAGAGSLVYSLRQHNFDVEGCEFSNSGRTLAEKAFSLQLPYCDLRESLPYKTNEFSYSYCVGVLSMIPHDYLATALAEIFRVTSIAVLVNIGTFTN